MCTTCRWYQYINDPEFGRHKECTAGEGDICPATASRERDTTEYVGDSAYDRALAAGLHPTEIPESWKHL